MFYVTLPICCGIHIANNYRREPNATLNRITSFAIPLLAAAGLGFVAGRYPGNFFEGFSFTFIPYPIARALSALKSICIQHGQSLATFLNKFTPEALGQGFGILNYIYFPLVLSTPHFVAAPVVASFAYIIFGLMHAAETCSGTPWAKLIIIIIYQSIFIIIYFVRLVVEYIGNHR